MKLLKLAFFSFLAFSLVGCYSVSQVGNCKYYTPKFKSTYYKQVKPIGF